MNPMMKKNMIHMDKYYEEIKNRPDISIGEMNERANKEMGKQFRQWLILALITILVIVIF